MDTAFRVLLLLGIVAGLVCVAPGLFLLSRRLAGHNEIAIKHFGTVKTTSNGVVCLFFGAFFFASASVGYAETENAQNQIESLKRFIYEDWTIELKSTGLGEIKSRTENREIQVLITPPISQVFDNGFVSIDRVPVRRSRSTGELSFPKIFLLPPPHTNGTFGTKQIDLSDDKTLLKKLSRDEKKITVEGDLSLPHNADSYDSSGSTTATPVQ